MSYHCQQNLINPNENFKAVLEFVCHEANNLINCGIYYCRQLYFKAKAYVTGYELDKLMKRNLHFKALRSSVAQQALHKVADSFKSYKKLKALYFEGKLENKPRVPNYRKSGGLAPVVYSSRWVKLTKNGIKCPLGKQVKAWFGLDCFYLPMPTNLEFSEIKEIRIVPKNNCFYAEYVTEALVLKVNLNPNNALGIDHGLDNWLTCVSNIGKSFIIDGRKVKSQNQWYNKKVAKLKTGKAQDYWNEELAAITEKRNRQMRDNVNKAARFIINYCLSNNIGTIVFGWNIRQKDSINIGKKNNKKFVQIPTAKLKSRIEQLCLDYGIKFVETEESYTSQASFLDNDSLPKYGEKPNDWKASGKRSKRGLYFPKFQKGINADCNGAANILRKVSIQLGISLVKVCRAFLTAPKRYSLHEDLCREYRKRVEQATALAKKSDFQ